jgi:hypothetical protein
MQSIILVAVVVFVGFYILRKITRFFFRAIMFLALIGLSFLILYVFEMPPFEKDLINVAVLKEKYCYSDNIDKTNAICECVIPYLQNEQNDAKIDNSRWGDLVATRKMLSSNRSKILECYTKKGFENVGWETILKTILTDSKPTKND